MSNFNNNQTQDSGAIPVRAVLMSIPDPAELMTPPPATLAPSAVWDSGPISGGGFSKLVATAQLNQTGTLSIARYIDLLGLVPVGPVPVQAMTANILASVAVNDGYPFASWRVKVTNTSGSTANLTNVNLLEQS